MSSKNTIPSTDQSPVADSHASAMAQIRSGLTESTVPDPTAIPDHAADPAFSMAKEYTNLYSPDPKQS